jgi:hypothetical protein
MAESASKPVLVEYDVQRPFLRLLFGFLETIAFVTYQHGYYTRLPPPAPCTGGWAAGLEFLAYFGVLAFLIEMIHWIVWRIVHRKEILPFEEEQRLFGKPTRLGVRNRGTQTEGVLQLFGPSSEASQEVSPPISSGPKDYVLVESGGRLPLVPRNPLLAAFLGFGLLVLVLLLHSPGSVDSCTQSTFLWPELLPRLIVAYAFLAFGSIVEFRIIGESRRSANPA